MKNFLVVFLFLLPFVFGFSGNSEIPNPKSETLCTCPGVSNIQITSQGTSSISFSWSAPPGATEYKLWYYRESDGYRSANYFTANTYYSYSSLSEGRYVFYFQSICGEEPSGIIGTIDVNIN